ncbi:MAG: protein kinase [Actinomycetaceae bacterium]|nr:protein kinase [Actinomycetaceae bacterium]
MGAREYQITEPLTMTANGPLWRGLNREGQPCLVRFISRADRERYRERLQTLLSIRSDFVMQVNDIIEDGNRVALICEELDGIALSHVQAQASALTIRKAERIMLDIARGLEAMHAHGIAHGDVSAANIIVGDRATLVDLIDSGDGTDPYRAPERLANHQLSVEDMCRCDVWAWGYIAHELGVSLPLADRALANDPMVRPTMSEIIASFDGRDHGEMPPSDNVGDAARADRLLRLEADRERTHHQRAPGRHRRSKRQSSRSLFLALVLMVGIGTAGLLKVLPITGPSFVGVRADADTDRSTAVSLTESDAAHYASHPEAPHDPNDDRTEETISRRSLPATEETPPTCPTDTDATTILADLSARRAQAITQQDEKSLDTIFSAESAALVVDTQLVQSLREHGIEIRGLRSSISDVSVVDCADIVTVIATVTRQAYTRCHTGVCEEVDASQPRTMEFKFSGPPWRVVSISTTGMTQE